MKLAAAQSLAEPDDDALDGFGSETEHVTVRQPRPRTWAWAMAMALLVVSAVVAYAAWRGLIAIPDRLATITIESTPTGAEVFVSGASKGRTPLSFQAPSGDYSVEVVSGGERVPVHVSARAGSAVSHHVRFAAPPAPAREPAVLLVSTDPARLHVSIDDVDRGLAPVRVAGVSAGSHRIRVSAAAGIVERTVEVKEGESLSVVVAAASSAAADLTSAAGWITVVSPIPLKLIEAGQVVGSSDSARIMLATGAHDIQFVNDSLSFRESRRVPITGGKTATIHIDVPKGRLSINAVPWADVWVDSDHLGETPIGNFAVPIGTHQIVFRHPQLGERREQVTVGTRDGVRVAVDFAKR